MKYVVYGAGAIGGVIGARLHELGRDVVLICRGAQIDAVRRDGLTVKTPDGTATFRVPAVAHPSEIDLTPDDVIFLAMKSQDTEGALRELVAVAPAAVAI